MLLTLDLGGHLGWTLGPMDAGAMGPTDFRWGTIKLRDTTDIGAWLLSADDPLRGLFAQDVTDLAIENPNTARQNHHAIVKLVSLLGHCRYWGTIQGFGRPQMVNVSDIKVSMTGNGNAKKEQVIAAAIAMGFAVDTEHEADAIGIRRVVLLGVPESNAQRATREGKERAAAKRAEREAKKAPALL